MTRQQFSPNLCACGCGRHPRNFYAKFVAGHRPKVNPVPRFWGKVEKQADDGCWVWTGAIGSHGYGTFWTGSEFVLAHRYALGLLGLLDPELHVDHLCRVRSCVRPDHLECVTQAENNDRMQAVVRERATHCKHGHEFTPDNTFRNVNGYRECRTCIRERNAVAYLRRKAGAT